MHEIIQIKITIYKVGYFNWLVHRHRVKRPRVKTGQRVKRQRVKRHMSKSETNGQNFI